MIESAQVEEQVVVFKLADGEYGLNLSSVREIIRVSKITPVPRAPATVAGVTNLRGGVVPVIDLRKRFALAAVPDSASSRVIVMNAGGQLVGLKVDAATEVIGLSGGDVQDPPEMGLDEHMKDAIRAVARFGDRLIILLDAERILPSAEVREAVGEAEAVAGEE